MSEFLSMHAAALQQKTLEHIALSGSSLLLASLIAIPLGIGIARSPILQKIILPVGSVSQTIPCLAMLGFLIPLFGLGNLPTLIALTFYAIYPLMKNTCTGLKNIPAECLEAAHGLGFSSFQTLRFVELPLALPVIISGVRVATAMTIGITSIAALIGAGGLGDFIMQGLALNDTSLILLGAFPTAMLALFCDFIISQLEIQLQHRSETHLKSAKIKKPLFIALSLIGLLGIGFFCYQEYAKKTNPSLVIASKNFTESFILAELMAQLIEAKTSLNVVRKFNLGTTQVIHQAMLMKAIDIYPEYTGTAYLTVLKKDLKPNSGSLFSEVKALYREKFDLTWLSPFGFSNSQTLAITPDCAQRHQVKTLSDLKHISHTLTIACPPEFLKRPDALPGLLKVYGLRFKDIIQMDPNLIYTAIDNDKVDVVTAFSTDGKLQKYKLLVLKDDQHFYPSYEAAPIVRQATLALHPEIYPALVHLFGAINQKKMMELNYQVDVEGKSPKEVAHQFLEDINLI